MLKLVIAARQASTLPSCGDKSPRPANRSRIACRLEGLELTELCSRIASGELSFEACDDPGCLRLEEDSDGTCDEKLGPASSPMPLALPDRPLPTSTVTNTITSGHIRPSPMLRKHGNTSSNWKSSLPPGSSRTSEERTDSHFHLRRKILPALTFNLVSHLTHHINSLLSLPSSIRYISTTFNTVSALLIDFHTKLVS
jgi:hypothetical protein